LFVKEKRYGSVFGYFGKGGRRHAADVQHAVLRKLGLPRVDNSEREESFILSRCKFKKTQPAAKPLGVGCKAGQ